jgi:hypothetical protein
VATLQLAIRQDADTSLGASSIDDDSGRHELDVPGSQVGDASRLMGG